MPGLAPRNAVAQHLLPQELETWTPLAEDTGVCYELEMTPLQARKRSLALAQGSGRTGDPEKVRRAWPVVANM
jgi:hypothetical protein